MPTETTGNRTKLELAEALKQLLRKKPLTQLRVRELTEWCCIRRQSFYYHFADVYQLFDWAIGQEREALLERQERYLTWQQALRDLLDCTAGERAFYRAILENRGRDGLREVLRPPVSQLLKKTLTYYRERCGAPHDPAAERAQLLCWEMIWLSLLEGWLQGDLEQPPENMIAEMEQMLRQSTAGAVWQNLARWELPE